MKTKGFTLVELLVVIAILAILATVSVVGYTAYINNAEEEAANTELNAAHDAIINALVLDKQVQLEVDSKIVVFTRDGNSFTVAVAESSDATELEGIPSELVAKLSVVDNTGDSEDVLVYAYDEASTTTKYDVKTLAEHK